MRGLQAKILAAACLVAASSIAAVSILSFRVTRHELIRLDRARGAVADFGALAADLERSYARNGGWTDAARILESAAGPQTAVFVADASGRLVARSAAARGFDFETRPPDLVVLRSTAPRKGVLEFHGVGRPLKGPAGEPLGTLYAMPLPDLSPLTRASLGTVRRWLARLAVATGLLALGGLAVILRRLLEPVEELTAAARRMERGDFGSRVAAKTGDEVGDLGRAFNALAGSLEAAERQRRVLVDDIAHELRTPLTNLRSQIESAQDGLAAADDSFLESLREEVLILARLIDDLDTVALAESGRLPLEILDLDAAETLQAAVRAVRPRAHARGVDVEAVPVGPPLRFLGDRERVGQILGNLLENALAHTPAGGSVTASARRAGGRVELEIADTGEGIAPEHLPHVFDRFYRADPSRSRDTGGSGLGLSIVRRLAAAQGADVRAESQLGRGSRFAVAFPAALPAAVTGRS